MFPNLRPSDVWAGLSLFQLAFDPQDSHNHAAFLYRDPVEVAGTTRKAEQAALHDTIGLDALLAIEKATVEK